MSTLPLVLVHGFMGGSEQWELQKKEFTRYHTVIAIDLPGFGRKNHLEAPNTIAGFAEHVLEDLTKQNVEKFKLLGHSMGGMIVQEMIAIAPERIESFILYGTAATGELPDRFETFETSKLRISEDGVLVSARRISATWFRDYEDAPGYESCATLAEQSSLPAVLSALDAMKNWTGSKRLQEISCPSLIVWGECDRTYHWAQVEELWKIIPEVSLAVLPGCAHIAHLEKPNIFNAVLSDFLSQ